MALGIEVSSHVKSSMFRGVLKLIVRNFLGNKRWKIRVKYPSDVENKFVSVDVFDFRLYVRLFSSKAIVNPIRVTKIAVVFKYQGIVITWIDVVGMLYVMINPANILPMAKRLMGFISLGLFSFSVIRGR